ncbi:MAG: bifunctional 5,10-methylenetetrahydrofolate dehydrogenase/5,10-methenyltetrahydrofolate cyclohydrolase [Syntrophomonadaceae bacterium]|nr:bifunctional 5,10-methylenetetrahydrofolate dehydrogenase/5,10-methenyltetrahydrofolate cyclohydrolase [Syntrophomonadaceae bacterium]
MSAGDPRIIFGKDLADAIIDEVTDEVEKLRAAGHQPLLMTLEAGGDPASKVYQESQRRVARRAGINYETIELSEATSQQRLLKYVDRINRDPYINGLIVNLPLPESINTTQVQWAIDRKKDVEGVTPCNLGGLFLGAEGLRPCTAQAILALIKSTGIELRGKEVVVVGHSEIVGKPTALLLLHEDATVSVCHYATSQRGMLEEHVRNAEILVVAVGKPGLIKGEWIKEGALVIDAGINNVDDKIVGDVEFESALERAAYITPVPGGVGAVTVAYLMKNTLEALCWQMKANS